MGCRHLAIGVACLLDVAMSGGSVRAEPSVAVLPLPFAVTQFRGPSSRVSATVASTDAFRDRRPALGGPIVTVWGEGGGAALTLKGQELTVSLARQASDFLSLEMSRNAIPSSRLKSEGPTTVTLETATREYQHEALGSGVHAHVVAITTLKALPPTSEPKPVAADQIRIEAVPNTVFEDREPRLVDLNGDGVPEIVVVRSDRSKGSALVVIGRREGMWRVVAETPPDGEPFRWLNPAAAGPIGPGGSAEIAIVRRPHLDGVLQLWGVKDDRLTLLAERVGYANHVYGSTAQELAALLDGVPGGAMQLAIPTLDRKSIAFVTLDRSLAETARIALPARVLTGVAVLGRGREAHVVVGLEDGRLVDIRP